MTQKGKPRYHTLKLAVEASKANDTIRIDGNGPFKVPHSMINHNLNIQAGFGYEPLMRYDIGYGKNGLRSDPARDEESRYMFKVTQGTLTLEGLRMEMDAPNVGRSNISWNAIRLTGGDLKLLNCRISESNRKGMAAIHMEKPGFLLVKNSMLIGGRASLEIEGNGKQDIQIENSLIFSNIGIQFLSKTGNDEADVNLKFSQISLQALSAFTMKNFDGAIAFESQASVFKVKELGMSMLKAGNKKTGRSWSGENNVYDTSKWLGSKGKRHSSVRDARSWSGFWGKKDIKATKKTIGFTNRRNPGSYSHSVKSEDWGLKEYSTVAVMRPRRGIRSGMVGSGFGFSRFRDSIVYNKWKKENSSLSAPK